jgi:peptidoglycan/LPS O-acetylase OafA/YrhL
MVSISRVRTGGMRADDSRSLPHFPALDGLRGVAVLLVVVYHSWLMPIADGLDHIATSLAALGWSGVQLFFVLSGFLITGILLDSKDGRNYFRNFYVRRVLRIFPLYYAVLALYLILAPAVLPPRLQTPIPKVPGQELWYVFYLSNFSMARLGVIGAPALGLTWSLAVEEQFYLVWPLVVWLLPRKWLLCLCVALVILAFGWRTGMTLTGANPIATYVMTQSEFGGLAVGAVLAIAHRGPGGLGPLAGWARGLLVATPVFILGINARAVANGHGYVQFDPLMETAGLLLLQLFFASTLVLALRGALVGRLMRVRPLCACGRWSYGIYLFHPLVMVLAQVLTGTHSWPLLFGSALPKQLVLTALGIGLSSAVAALSWNLYEQPFLRLKRFFPMGARPKEAANDYPPSESPELVS